MGKYAVTEQHEADTKTSKNAGARRRLMIWLSFMVVFVVWGGYTFIAQLGQMADKSAVLEKNQSAAAAVKQSENQLSYEVNRLHDPEYIGQLARKNFGWYKPGETPIHTDATNP
ncbi:FtsB family cell division protein [Paenibacillus pini]|uniref:Cell division protein DivIC n=1 Tax=Paenibacillus pini JCM 16418 TaxID=1236976 RepID=W7YI76_9BACL|nr:septum formation initiator family protein [Paenibacillus pini]GAF10570.1 hypothetical protein JCM16418_4782 [Paenibacillus pini JCM 16418]